MLAINISDKSLEAIKFSQLLWWRSFSYISQREFPQGLKQNELIKNFREIGLKNEKCFFTLPDSKILTYRFEIPFDVTGEALKTTVLTKAKELIPADMFADLVYDYTVKDSKVLFLTLPRETLTSYLEVFPSLNLAPVFATSESLAVWETFRQTIIEDEAIILVEVREKTSQLSFFDQLGPILELKKEVKTLDLEEETKRARRDFWKKQGTMIKRIILADAHEIYQHKGNNGLFSQAVGIWTNDLKNILEDKLKKLDINYNFANLPLTSFSRTIGLTLLAQDKHSLNFLKEANTLHAAA